MKSKKFVLILMVVSMLLCVSSFVSAQTNTGNSAVSEQAQMSTQQTTVITGGETVDDSNLQHRSFSGGGVSFPSAPLVNYWGTITADGRFEPARNILSFRRSWTEGAARALAEQEGGKVKFSLSGVLLNNIPPTKSITFIFPFQQNKPTKPQDERFAKSQDEAMEKMLADFNSKYELIQTGYFYSEGKIVSSKLLGEAALQGLKCGADAVLYTEGFSLRIDAESWSIGIGTSVSAVSGGGPTSNGIGAVGGGGLGWSNAWAEYYSRPWLRVSYFRVKNASVNIRDLGTPKEAVGASETKNGELFKPEIASPPELQTGVNGSKEQIRKLNPGAVQQP